MLGPDPNLVPVPDSGTVMHSGSDSAKAKKLRLLRFRFLNTAFNAQQSTSSTFRWCVAEKNYLNLTSLTSCWWPVIRAWDFFSVSGFHINSVKSSLPETKTDNLRYHLWFTKITGSHLVISFSKILLVFLIFISKISLICLSFIYKIIFHTRKAVCRFGTIKELSTMCKQVYQNICKSDTPIPSATKIVVE
jgi:hypothetical protein